MKGGEIMKGYIKRSDLEQIVINTLLAKGNMEEVYKLIKKLNIQVREG